ncbi:MAG: caspase family protein [Elusimicrobiales bacterium]
MNEIGTLDWPGAEPVAVAFSPDGSRLYSVSVFKGIGIWDTDNLKNFTSFPLRGGLSPASLSVHPSGKAFAVTSAWQSVSLLDLTGKQLARIPGGREANFSPNGDFLTVTSQDRNGGIYSVNSEDFTLKPYRMIPLRGAIFSADSRRLLFLKHEDTLVAHDLETGSETSLGGPIIDTIKALAVNPDSTILVAAGMGMGRCITRVWDLISLYRKDALYFYPDRITPGDYLTKFYDLKDLIEGCFRSFAFSPDGKILAGYAEYGKRGTFLLIDPANWTVIRKLEAPPLDDLHKILFTNDGYHIIASIKNQYFGLWRVEDGKLEKTFGEYQYRGNLDFSLSPDSSLLAYSRGGAISIWDISRGAITCKIPLKGGMPADGSVVFYDNASILHYDEQTRIATKWSTTGDKLETITGASSDILHPQDTPIPKLIAKNEGSYISLLNPRLKRSVILTSKDSEWLIAAPDGYFDASPHGGNLAAMVKGFEGYSIDQFAVRNNRPDIILERMGLGAPGEVPHYLSLHRSRLNKLGLAEADLTAKSSAPEVRILSTKVEDKIATVNFEIKSHGSELKRYNFYVNNVPIFGALGKALKGRRLSGSRKIELIHGRNKIEVTAINRAGVESIRAHTYADYKNKSNGALYFLGFGASKYRNETLDLDYADKDVKDLASVVSGMDKGFTAIHTKILTNEEVTAEKIINSKSFFANAGADDTVILFIAGHGGYDKGSTPRYYYLPFEADRENLAGTGVDFETIESLLDGIAPRKKLFLLDTCESGELDDYTFTQYLTLASGRGIKPRASNRIGRSRGKKPGLPRTYLYNKNRYIYNNISRRTGAIVFSSSRAGEISYESSGIQNGFFTEEIIRALTSKVADKNDNNKIDVVELLDYVSGTVAKDTSSLQHPTIDRDNLEQKIELPLSSTLEH